MFQTLLGYLGYFKTLLDLFKTLSLVILRIGYESSWFDWELALQILSDMFKNLQYFFKSLPDSFKTVPDLIRTLQDSIHNSRRLSSLYQTDLKLFLTYLSFFKTHSYMPQTLPDYLRPFKTLVNWFNMRLSLNLLRIRLTLLESCVLIWNPSRLLNIHSKLLWRF